MSFTKPTPRQAPRAGAIEAAGLRWLAEAEDRGGAAVVQVLTVEDDALVLESIIEAMPDRDAAEAFGRALARTHRSLPEGTAFGALPPEHPHGEPPLFGPAEQLLPLGAATHPSWGAFHARERLDPLLERLDRKPAPLRAARDRIAAGDFDGAAAGEEPPSRLHGDLWAGNLLWREAELGEAAQGAGPSRAIRG